ncbi:MAG: GGDEF domain-containing protein [Lachnospiraceae bacterium]|jgi:diguanylate cyclase (GGDEF)-like protein|nr:GGDEF domain-containing protein [Lachnospiraceae bacterium]
MEEKKKKQVRGIRISTVNMIMIFISCALYVLLITATVRVSDRYKDVHSSMDDYIAFEENEALLTDGSAYLTEQVRLYTVTLEPQYMEAYFTEANVTKRRETALEELKTSHEGNKAYEYLAEALGHSNDLMNDEIYAMRLISEAQGYPEDRLPEEVQAVPLNDGDQNMSQEEMIQKAREIVFGTSYQEVKTRISDSVNSSVESIHEMTHQQMLGDAEELESTMAIQRRLISILFVETIATFLLIIMLIIKPLRVYVNCIKEEKMMEITGSYEFKYLALTYNDIFEIKNANEAMLRYRAEHDPLTGIVNRGGFEQLKNMFRVKDVALGLLIVDVDKFKLVNDGYGHEVGDQVLKKVAAFLKDGFRATDYPARIGGDEFAVILTSMSEEMQGAVERKITEMNDRLMHPNDGLPQVSLSVGGAFSENGFTDDLYQKADAALYAVKENGRCGCRFYEEGMKTS